MIQTWKIPPILKGMLTWLPPFNAWRLRRARTGGSDSFRYCYAVWLRHLTTLQCYGFSVKKAHVGELGPGDSIGTGLAALLSGAERYVGLDAVPFSAKADLEEIFDNLVQMYVRRERIPDHNEFPRVRPQLKSYEFPNHAIEWHDFAVRVDRIRSDLRTDLTGGRTVSYRAPWNLLDDTAVESLDLIISQAVLEHVDAVEETYGAMFALLKPGGFASHNIDFSAHSLSPSWNGHWAYSDWEWKFVRGRREFLLNRRPLSEHLHHAGRAGFEVLLCKPEYDDGGFRRDVLQGRFRLLDDNDARTRGATLILRKPKANSICSTKLS
jgi:SAM-dependent methyltransferase